MISLKTQQHWMCRCACVCVWLSGSLLPVAMRSSVCSLTARWGLCTFILIDSFCLSQSPLWDIGGRAERLDSSPAAGGDSVSGSRTFQSSKQMFAETPGPPVAAKRSHGQPHWFKNLHKNHLFNISGSNIIWEINVKGLRADLQSCC